MKNPILKSKSTFLALSAIVIMGVGTLAFAKIQHDVSKNSFMTSGEIITTNQLAESTVYAFPEETTYTKKIGDMIAFEDVQSNIVEVSNENFVFYNNGAITALTKGVLLDIDDVAGDQYINNYSLQSHATIVSGNTGIGINNGIEDIFIDEAMWKISDDQYLILADDMSVNFTEDDQRPVQEYIMLNYVDAGVVQIITEENVWQTVSTTAHIETGKGAVINLHDQLIEHHGSQMLMSKLIIDSDANIEASPLETTTQVLPEFNITGESGDDGTGGDEGDMGDEGSSGQKGTEGDEGDHGDEGSNGQLGTYAADGSTGTQGESGSSGSKGTTGASGDDSLEGSTMTTNIPSVSLTNWSVNATGIDATYSVTDEDGLMSSDLSIVIYEAGSGVEYACVNEFGYSDEFVTHQDLSFMNDESLQPDTAYTLSITGEFELDGKVQREFISKTFYTDSIGVFIDVEAVNTSEVHLNIEQMDYSLAKNVSVYLIPESDSINFDPTNTAYKPVTIELSPLTNSAGTVVFDSNYTLPDGSNIKSNTTYVVRMVMELQGEAASFLSQQVLTVKTLKITPTFTGNAIAISNRSSWAFELYGCTVLDPDNAITSYVYDVYCAEPNDPNYGKVVRSFNIAPAASGEATQLYIDSETIKSDTKYYFSITTVYNDNEKTVDLVNATSAEFSMTGTQLPTIYFDKSEEDSAYESLVGTLYVNLNDSHIKVDTANPLYVYIECEGIYEKTIKFDDMTTGNLTANGDNGVKIRLEEYGLNEDKIYRISVKATVDLADGNGYVSRTIGHVAVTTDVIPTVNTIWATTPNQNTSNVFSRKLTLTSFGSDNVLTAGSIESKTLSQVNVSLTMLKDQDIVLGTVSFTDKDAEIYATDLTEMFTEGVVITESDFGLSQAQLTSNEGYLLIVTSIYDYTKTHPTAGDANKNGYINEFQLAGSVSTVVKPNELPSVLPEVEDLSSSISTDYIYNSEAATYGGTVDSNLTDDTIVGVKLNFGYVNSALLARNLIFYAFDTEDYDKEDRKAELIFERDNYVDYPGPNNGNLITQGTWKYRNNVSISKSYSSNTLPSVAIMFGNGTDTVKNGYNIFFTNEMSRGYMYRFAYAVEYVETQEEDMATHVYPYQYEPFHELTQTEKMNYILHSAIVEVPKTTPSMYMYVYNQTAEILDIQYLYIDCDSAMVENGILQGNQGSGIGNTASNQDEWHKISVVDDGFYSNLNFFKMSYSINLFDDKYSKTTTKSVSTPIDGGSKLNTSHLNNVTMTCEVTDINMQLDFNIENNNEINKRITGVDLSFNPAQGDEVTIRKNLSTDEFTVVIPITELEAYNLVGKGDITITAKVYYDTGYVSWAAFESGDYVALQSFTSTSALGNYIGYSTLTGYQTAGYAMGSSYVKTSDTQSLSGIGITSSVFIKYVPVLVENLNTTGFYTKTMTTWIYSGGLYFRSLTDETESVKQVAKRIESKTLSSVKIDEVRAVVPSVSIQDLEIHTNYVVLNELNLSGTNFITENEDGKKIITLEITEVKTNEIQTVEIDLDTYEMSSNISLMLDKNTEYSVLAYATVDGVEYVQLKDAKSEVGDDWKISFTTLESIIIENDAYIFRYPTYAEHNLVLYYGLSQTNNIYIEYSIKSADGNTVIVSYDELASLGLLSSTMNPLAYSENMEDTILLTPGALTSYLSPGVEYSVSINIYDYKNGVKDTSKPLLDEEYVIPFTYQSLHEPTVFNTTWVNDGSVHFQFSLNDSDKIIMTDYLDNGASKDTIYYAKIFKVEGTTYTDVTPVNLECKGGISYTITVDDYSDGESYQLVLYSTYDLDYDGIHDGYTSTDIRTGITSVDKTILNNNLNSFKLYESAVFNTQDPESISLGSQYLLTQNNTIRVEYTLPNKINEITRIEYSVINASGVEIAGEIDNSNGNMFVLQAGSLYTLDLPVVLGTKGWYNVTLDYYVGNVRINRFSSSCYY